MRGGGLRWIHAGPFSNCCLIINNVGERNDNVENRNHRIELST